MSTLAPEIKERAAGPAPAPEAALRAALSVRSRPPRAGWMTASLTFTWRALLKMKHVPMQLFDVTMFPIIFTLLFTFIFGGALAGSTRDYLQYLLPGILVQTVSFITMYTGMGINLDVTKGVFDRFRTLPIWRPAPLVGMLLGDVVRYSIAFMVVVILGLILGFRPAGGVTGIIASLAIVLVFAFSLSWIWIMTGLLLKSQESLMMMSSMIMFLLTFVSSIFVDPKTMPGFLQVFVGLNPVTHTANAVRALMEGGFPAGAMGLVLLDSALITAIFGPLTMRLYNRKK